MKTVWQTAALLALAACTAGQNPQAGQTPAGQSRAQDAAAPSLEGGWRIAEIGGAALPADANARLSFDAARSAFGGSAGCNKLSGSYEAGASGLKFAAPASTLMACEPALMKREQALAAALEQTAAYAFDKGSLLLKDKQGNTLLKAVK
ncbi:META domain [Kingella potus]|uniref:META domain n=1 Tax=Kingella potus TaxID=265175 RepID=A0A377R1F0_9NEIS|nr:META domain-containing protein [Kingella potus]UOP01121.1 META domain-containing protein [Kingella potus]STR00820.1 META domain [Kingella potus]